MEIKKVKVRKDGIKFVLLPKKSEFEAGDLVMISKIEKEANEWQKKNLK